MDKTRTVSPKWLVNELVLSYGPSRKCAKTQSNTMIFSKVISFTNDEDRLKHTVETSFFLQGWGGGHKVNFIAPGGANKNTF